MQSEINKIFSNRVLRNILFWCIYFSIHFFIPYQRGIQIPFSFFIKIILLELFTLASVSYLNNLVLIPSFLNAKKYLVYFVTLSLAILFFAYIRLLLTNYWQIEREQANYSLQLMAVILFALLFMMSHFTIQWFESYNARREFENNRLQTELHILRAQINPHFLFNTLNNIYSLSLKKSDRTPECILMLSDMMRYMLYECNTERVLLDKEMDYIKNYLELEKIRLHNERLIQYDIRNESPNAEIAPLLLISFVENCFKHGSIVHEDEPLQVRITCKENQLQLFTKNKINVTKKSNEKIGGIGLHNTKKRLDILYKNRNTLIAKTENNFYLTELNINL